MIGRPKTGRRALVYFHGGHGISGNVETGAIDCDRYAVEADATVINVGYRLAPEARSPSGIFDGYAALKWIIANANTLGIDKGKVGMLGDSSGAWIASGVGMLMAERNEGKLLKFNLL